MADTWQETWRIRFDSNSARTLLKCPLFHDGAMWGMVEYASDSAQAFGEDTCDLLVNIAQSTELALTREHDRERRELELSRMDTVVNLAETTRTLRTRQEVFEEAVAAVMQRTQAHRGVLYWYDAELDALVIQAIVRSGDEVPEASPGFIVPRGKGASWLVLERDATVYIDDPQELERVQLYEEGVVSCAYVGTPLRDA